MQICTRLAPRAYIMYISYDDDIQLRAGTSSLYIWYMCAYTYADMLTYVLLIYVLRAPRYVLDDDMRRVYICRTKRSLGI